VTWNPTSHARRHLEAPLAWREEVRATKIKTSPCNNKKSHIREHMKKNRKIVSPRTCLSARILSSLLSVHTRLSVQDVLRPFLHERFFPQPAQKQSYKWVSIRFQIRDHVTSSDTSTLLSAYIYMCVCVYMSSGGPMTLCCASSLTEEYIKVCRRLVKQWWTGAINCAGLCKHDPLSAKKGAWQAPLCYESEGQLSRDPRPYFISPVHTR